MDGNGNFKDDRPVYHRYMAEMQKRFEETARFPDYNAKYRALKDAKIAREKAAREKVAREKVSAPPVQQPRAQMSPYSATATSDSEDTSDPLQGFNPRKERLHKESSREISSDDRATRRRPAPALPTRVKESASPVREIQGVPPARSETTWRSSSGASKGLTSKNPKVPENASADTQAKAWSAKRVKRPLDTHPTTDRRPSAPKQARRTYAASSSNLPAAPTPRRTRVDRVPPSWYQEILRPKQGVRGRNQSNAETSLVRLKDLINKAKKKVETTVAVPSADFAEILERLHTLAFLPVDGPLLKRLRILDNENGLPQLFDSEFSGGVQWPWYLKADAEEQYNKWCTRVFETDLYRGIERHNKGGKADSLTKAELESHSFRLMDPKQHGNGLLLNGAWWPAQLAALRDGGHGSSQGGITGGPETGAYSVIMAGGLDPQGQPYPNEDHGDMVLYCGTVNSNKDAVPQPSAHTRSLITNKERNLPVRLFRSHNLHSQYAPEVGFRYDGLYSVMDYEEMDPPGEKRCRHRFRLIRCAGQDPIRSNGPEKRPTKQEVEEYEKDRKNHGR